MSARVLFVEDEADAREVLVRALERVGYACVSAASHAEAMRALEASAAEPFDAAVVDLVLGPDAPGGEDLVPRIRAASRTAPIVVITAFADVDRLKRVLNAGASFLLEKPFRAPELLGVLARLLAERDDVSALVERALLRAKLTEKETQIARLLLKGLPSAEIARLEGNSDKTIRQHVSQIYVKCGVSSRPEFFHFVFPT
jgi:DNA-binding NarL/FixJ family response regulator